MKSWTRRICALALAVGAGAAWAQTPPAFPGAEGFGAIATGGRGGRVVYVTNLNTGGPGSLQAALDETGPRYVLFKVSGLIPGPVQLTTDDVTIAGQTSPGGIIMRGFHTTEEPFCGDDPVCIQTAATADNWILRHVRLRPGDSAGGLDDGLRLLHTRRAIVDHVSIANATDEAVQVSYSNDLTLQHTLIAETLGDHADRGGLLLNYSDPSVGYELSRLSFHHNNWNRIAGRMPEVSRESTAAANTTMDLELSSNLLWDPDYFIDTVRETFPYGPEPSAPVFYRFNWVSNYSVARPGYSYGMISFPEPLVAGPTTTYWSGNRLNLYPGRQDYQLEYCCNDYPTYTPPPGSPAWAVGTRHAFPAIGYTPADGLREHVLSNVGAFPRDPMDRRLLAPLQANVIDPTARNVNPWNDAWLLDFDPLSPPPAPLDGDGDGLPDAWEQSYGLDPAVPDHNGTQLSVAITGVPGYTNLECYLNQLADQRVRAARAKADFAQDGRTDLVLQRATGALDVWQMAEVAGQATRLAELRVVPDPPAPPWQVVGADDFDADLRGDLVLWNGSTGEVRFWLMNGPNRVADVALTGGALAPPWTPAATADFDGDGRPDLLWRNASTQKLVVWKLLGTTKAGEIVPSPDQAIAANWAVTAALDWNGDGWSDLLWYNATSGRIVLWFMNRLVERTAGQFANPTSAGNDNWKVVAAGDYGVGPGGRQGTKDVVWRNDTSGRLVTWFMDLAGNRTSGQFVNPGEPSDPLGTRVVGPR